MNVFGNWRDTTSEFQRAQKNYDAQMPEEVWDCKEQGHRWKRMPGQAADGTKLAKCIKCGLEAEV